MKSIFYFDKTSITGILGFIVNSSRTRVIEQSPDNTNYGYNGKNLLSVIPIHNASDNIDIYYFMEVLPTIDWVKQICIDKPNTQIMVFGKYFEPGFIIYPQVQQILDSTNNEVLNLYEYFTSHQMLHVHTNKNLLRLCQLWSLYIKTYNGISNSWITDAYNFLIGMIQEYSTNDSMYSKFGLISNFEILGKFQTKINYHTMLNTLQNMLVRAIVIPLPRNPQFPEIPQMRAFNVFKIAATQDIMYSVDKEITNYLSNQYSDNYDNFVEYYTISNNPVSVVNVVLKPAAFIVSPTDIRNYSEAMNYFNANTQNQTNTKYSLALEYILNHYNITSDNTVFNLNGTISFTVPSINNFF